MPRRKQHTSASIDELRLREFLALIGQLCPDCQAKMRAKFAQDIGPRTYADIETERISPIIFLVAEERKLAAEAIVGPSMEKRYVEARREIAIRARDRGFAFVAIGRALRRDHSTIVHLLRNGKEN